MELLNGKAKEIFLEYYWQTRINPLPMTICKKEDLAEFFETIIDILQHALIIEWLDSVGIYIGIVRFNVGLGYFEYRIHYKDIYGQRTTRQEAVQSAIKKAVEIYNQTK